jgi:rhamnose transport system permease protein
MSSAAGAPAASRARALLRRSEAALLLIIICAGVAAALGLPSFRNSAGLTFDLNTACFLAVFALAEAVVLLARQIDLSVGAILGLTAYLVGSAVGHLSGAASPILGVLMALGLGAALGAVNASLVVWVRMPAIIATLATLGIYSGLQVIVNHGSQLYRTQVPSWLVNLESTSWLGVGAFVWIAAICLLVVAFLARMTRWGRDVYAMGSNPEAAAYLGIRVRRRLYQSFMLCGALSGLGGLLYVGTIGNVDAGAGAGYELTAIAAAVIGGVSLFGGSGTPLGAVLGAFLYTEITSILPLLQISTAAIQMFQGIAIVVAVALYAVLSRRLRRPVRRHALAEPTAGTRGGRSTPESPGPDRLSGAPA